METQVARETLMSLRLLELRRACAAAALAEGGVTVFLVADGGERFRLETLSGWSSTVQDELGMIQTLRNLEARTNEGDRIEADLEIPGLVSSGRVRITVNPAKFSRMERHKGDEDYRS